MLSKFRNSTRQLVERQQTGTSNTRPIPNPDTATPRGTLSFFDLPAEIRNVIYEEIASHTSIYITNKANIKTAEPIPSLLIASKQASQEYLPLLLQFSSIRTTVNQFDFRNLVKILSSLNDTQLKALQCNGRITIHLVCEKHHSHSIPNLRRWLSYRVNNLDRLSWEYKVQWKRYAIMSSSNPMQTMNTYIARQRVLEQNLELQSELYHNVGEALQPALQLIADAFAVELERTTSITGSASAQNYAANMPEKPSSNAAPSCIPQ